MCYPARFPGEGWRGQRRRSISRRIDILAILCLLGAIVCWGVPPVMLRYLTAHIPDGFTTNLVRYPIATLAYVPLLIVLVRQSPGGLGRFWIAALLPAGVNVVGQTLFAVAPYHLEAGTMSFLLRLSTVWSVLGAFWLFRDERPLARSGLFWLGAATAIAGFVVMSLVGLTGFAVTVAGITIVFACSIFWGLYDVTVRYTMRDLHPLVVFGVIGNYSSVALLLMAPLGDPRSVLELDRWNLALLIISAYIGIALAHGMYYVAIQRLGVAVSAITMMLMPFVSILGAAIYLGERFSTMQWIGGIMLIGGAALTLWSRERIRRAPPVPAPTYGGISPD
jgi:drug/metabolite transporter (DMT)-like permease